jgi:hypothetical protein
LQESGFRKETKKRRKIGKKPLPAGKVPEWSALEKPVAPALESAACRKLALISVSGAGEGI